MIMDLTSRLGSKAECKPLVIISVARNRIPVADEIGQIGGAPVKATHD